ncbi:uncharacterized protein LOC110460234 [Mizuhopecten yessoensis]|uniref:Uncharacterized protein n=1 Tax=Mizuhopecten yessoensis TaxID=6573 RepID=A0A210Q2Y9_MIZYE|nr:uncharacterized protein LOC110460234 [Mizuhopecten yessoensis]OWF43082.1 hypothetical protein KP79_PYT21596 [Mizuhopecten yessoensis]
MSTTLIELPPTTPKQHGGKKGAPGLITLSENQVIPVANIPLTPRAPQLNGAAKRGASGPIVTTSDEESDGCSSPRSNISHNLSYQPKHQSSSQNQHHQPQPPQSQSQQRAYEAYEHDHDYENVASPSGSSTASGPVYVRPPGFRHHAQEIKKTKKKKTALLEFRSSGLKKRAPTPPKVRPKRESVPMRLRALPQSFWKQPNVPNQVSPANVFPSLPPLYYKESMEEITDVRPITPPEEREARQKKTLQRPPERKLIIGDTDLLLKNLFAGVNQADEKKVQHIKRGRPRKVTVPKATSTKTLISGDDPYLMETMTEKFFPQLTLESRQAHLAGNTSLQLVTIRNGDKSVMLPSLSINQDYSQMLSELAMNI